MPPFGGGMEVVMKDGFYDEPSSRLQIYDECDILIVGSGSAGHSAAIAAARAGAKNIVLMERYGYSGGDVTGGLVLMVPDLSWYDKSFCRGLQEEWFTRLEKLGPEYVVGPKLKDIGSTDPALIHRWQTYMDCTSKSEPKRLVRSMYFDGEHLKIEMDKMLMEHKDAIRVMYHSWGTRPILDGNVCKGVVFESKEGRKAVFAKVVIDATGDGDLFRQTGAPYEGMSDPMTRGRVTTLGWRIGGVDSWAFIEWKLNHPKAAAAMREGIAKVAGTYGCFGIGSAHGPVQAGVHVIPNFHRDRNCASVKDLTETEMNTRVTIREIIDYMKEVCPVAFKNAYLYDIAPQTGVRCSYRLQGEYIMTPYDFAFAPKFDDVIAWHSTVCEINDCGPVEIPYRCIVPKGVENLLCPGRHLSTDEVAIDWLNLIPQCIGTGQAAGIAAHVAISSGTLVRDVDIKKVQDILVYQDVPLPRHPGTDSSYQECCEEHQYGLYTDLAKKANENREEFEKYRQSGIGGWEEYLKNVKSGH